MDLVADLTLVLLSAVGGAFLAQRFRQPLIVGYILAGVVVGPFTGGFTVGSTHDIGQLSELGVVLLLFSLGLEVSFHELRPVRTVALGGRDVADHSDDRVRFRHRPCARMGPGPALWFGALVSLSSTMVALKTIQAQGRLGTLSSRVMLGILVLQDLAIVPLTIILPELSNPASGIVRRGDRGGAGNGDPRRHRVRLDEARAPRDGVRGAVELPRALSVVDDCRRGWRRLRDVVVWTLDGARRVPRRPRDQRIGIRPPGAERRDPAARCVRHALLRVGRHAARSVVRLAASTCMLAAVVVAVIVGKAAILAVVVRVFGYKNVVPLATGLTLFQVGEFAFVLASVGRSTGAIGPTCTR